MRLFVAVELPEDVRQRLAALVETLRRELPRSRWVRAENLHITLAFLGETEESVARVLGERLARSVSELAPAVVRLAGGGFFPSVQRPRVAWIGGEAPGLRPWAAAAAREAGLAGATVDGKPFSLHLTLARLDTPWRAPEADRFMARLDNWEAAAFTAREMVLVASELRPGGPRYTTVGRWSAQGGTGT